MTKTFFIPNKQSILGEQEILTAKSILALVDDLESHSYDAVYLRQPLSRLEYIECAIVGNHNFFLRSVMLMVKRLTVSIFLIYSRRQTGRLSSHF